MPIRKGGSDTPSNDIAIRLWLMNSQQRRVDTHGQANHQGQDGCHDGEFQRWRTRSASAIICSSG